MMNEFKNKRLKAIEINKIEENLIFRTKKAYLRTLQKVIKMSKIKITQVKSGIDRPENQKRTLVALGLRKMNTTVEVEATKQIQGMVRTVQHLVKVEEVKG
jgi:large subunit ribosomal protein L30